MRGFPSLRALLFVLALVAGAGAQGQNKANWRLAERFSSDALRPFVYSLSMSPAFINKTDEFWYSWRDENGIKFYIVDPSRARKQFLFDSAKMAALLTEAMKKPYDTTNLPITTLDFDDTGRKFTFTVEKTKFEYNRDTQTLAVLPPPKDATPPAPLPGNPRRAPANGDFKNFSPDKKYYAYAEKHNLYLVDLADEKNPIQLTKDGEKDYSFGNRDDDGTVDQTKEKPDPRVWAPVTWSPDSKTFFVQRTDMRKVKDLYLVNNLAQPRPTLTTYKYAMPGEPDDGVQEFFVLDLEHKALNKLSLDKFFDQRVFEMQWLEDSKTLRFMRRNRTQREQELCDLDLATMAIKPLIYEQTDLGFLEHQPIRYLGKKDGDFVWWSERDGWGHLYRYDHDGKVKNRITEGPWRVDQIVDVDPDRGTIFFVGVGREPGEHSSYRHLYRVNPDGNGLQVLDAGRFDHASSISPSKKYIVDLCSRVDAEPRAIVMNADGKLVMNLEQTDTRKLLEWGWKPPEMFVTKSADGVTDIEGVMWKPLDFDPTKHYPIIANVYPGPQTEAVTTTFSPTNMNQRLANLGFIVVQIGNRGGNPRRSNAYHSYGYFNLRDYALADKKAGIEQLAAKYPWIDLDRVGIYGHSGGGFLTAAALLLPPYNDFFKVGVSSSGNHDNNIYNANWSEQNHGLKEVEVKDKDGNVTKKYEIKVPTNAELAGNLKGNLLLVTGDMDDNVHPANTVRLVDALIKANKRFDYLIMPGQAHGYGPDTAYFNQRLMEYFAEHLLDDRYTGSEMADKKSD